MVMSSFYSKLEQFKCYIKEGGSQNSDDTSTYVSLCGCGCEYVWGGMSCMDVGVGVCDTLCVPALNYQCFVCVCVILYCNTLYCFILYCVVVHCVVQWNLSKTATCGTVLTDL